MASTNSTKGTKLKPLVKLGSKHDTKNFKQIQNKNMEIAKKITENFESSSEEEEIDGSEILMQMYKNYTGGNDQLQKTAAFLENVLQSGSAICLICIGSVKRVDSIWSCKYCHCVFHLLCIKRWANDSINLMKKGTEEQAYYNNLGEFVPKKEKSIKWCCPQCRRDYHPDERPVEYECFCGKEINPVNQDWLIPHSCGETCGKPLQPECGHKCLLLCHPGPCPPCAQSISVSCKCGKSEPKVLRCFQKSWTCDIKCSRMLPCGQHKCDQLCHAEGDCPPCSRTSMQRCVCGAEEQLRSCSQRVWHCKKVCNKKYSCGVHCCKKVCHSGECGVCPLTLPRTCPCGKTRKVAPCTEAIESCNDTCHKLLSCGVHYCNQRCHKGNCSLCTIITKKTCRCGLHEKEMPCWKNYLCETKCKRIRDCGKHPCNKKCCDGQCPPCDKICGKLLSCKKHKCSSVCHDGPCYPCKLKSQVNCHCGSTSVTVPCGRERKARPACMQLCRVPSKCHHPNKHRCHKGACPPCSQMCGQKIDQNKCEHICQARCHAAVRVPIKQTSSNLMEYRMDSYEIKELPHPRCENKVQVGCIGGHEVCEWPCWNSKPTSCQRECGRELKCGNHKCNVVCHCVPDINSNQEQEGCEPCGEMCQIERPEGCTHSCKKLCHPAPCDPCTAIIKTPCHCGLSLVYFKCCEYHGLSGTPEEIAARREKLKNCGNRCIKNFPCGHRCSSICHSGPCPNPETCRKKVKVYCECKRIKAEMSCDKARTCVVLPCNDICIAVKEAEENLRKEKEEKQRLEEEERNRIELEQYEKKFGKKKTRERKSQPQEPKIKDNQIKVLIAATVGIAVAASAVFYFFNVEVDPEF